MAVWPYFLQGRIRGDKFYIFAQNVEKWGAKFYSFAQISKYEGGGGGGGGGAKPLSLPTYFIPIPGKEHIQSILSTVMGHGKVDSKDCTMPISLL